MNTALGATAVELGAAVAEPGQSGRSGAGGERQHQQHCTDAGCDAALHGSAPVGPRWTGIAGARGTAGHCTCGHSGITSVDWMDRRLRNTAIVVDRRTLAVRTKRKARTTGAGLRFS